MKREPVPTFNDNDVAERLDEYRAFVAMVALVPRKKPKFKRGDRRRNDVR